MRAKKIISLLISIVVIIGAISVSTVNASASTSGYGESTKVIQVWTNKTGSNPYITLKQTKGMYSLGGQKARSMYGYYNVTVKPVCTVDGKKTNYKKQNLVLDSSSLKINLKKGTYYEIIVSHNYTKTLEKAAGWFRIFNPTVRSRWTTNCHWYLSNTKNCSNYK